MGHPSTGFLPLDASDISISAHKNEVVIESCDNGFPGPVIMVSQAPLLLSTGLITCQQYNTIQYNTRVFSAPYTQNVASTYLISDVWIKVLAERESF